MTWYKEQKMLKLSSEHDKAIDEKNIELLQSLIEGSILLASKKELHPMIRAKHYYNSATSLYELQFLRDQNQLELEKNIEKILYFYRQSINLQEEYAEKKENIETEEQANFFAIYNSTIVNYSNLLSSLGRIPSAIASIKKSAVTGFGMAIGNMGEYLKHYAQVDYDTGHQGHHYIEMLKLLKKAVESKDPNVHSFAKEEFYKNIETILSLFKNMSYDDINDDTTLLFTKIDKTNWQDTDINEEARYLNWKVVSSLTLNTLNDYDRTINRTNDSLHLPNMVRPTDEIKPIYHGLFNQIKQEYCAARYLIFDGIYNKSIHFSDSDVYLVDTLDYPVYSVNIEKIKSAYRTIYSLFDRIAYFLNEYLDLGIKRDKVSFNSMWSEWSKRKKIFKKDYKSNKIFDIMNNNYLVRGLYWIKKDLYNNSKSGYNGVINPHLNRAYKIRNTMEHKYLKIIDNNFIDASKVEDSLAKMIISQQEFEQLAVDLLRTIREAIIILTQIVYIEEYKNGQSYFPGISLNYFSDEWKF